jgi:hypothetical protein
MKITYIMSEVQDFSVLYNNLAHPVIDESWHFTRKRNEHLHGRIISLRGEALIDKTSLTPPLYIEERVPGQESERSCIMC